MALPTPEEVRELIKLKVRDPELMMNIVDFNATRFQPSYYAGITPATVAIDFVIVPK